MTLTFANIGRGDKFCDTLGTAFIKAAVPMPLAYTCSSCDTDITKVRNAIRVQDGGWVHFCPTSPVQRYMSPEDQALRSAEAVVKRAHEESANLEQAIAMCGEKAGDEALDKQARQGFRADARWMQHKLDLLRYVLTGESTDSRT